MLRRSLPLLLLSVLASCASQPKHTIALAECPKPAELSPEMKQPPPSPQWFAKCLRQITDSPTIDADCLEPLQRWLTSNPQ